MVWLTHKGHRFWMRANTVSSMDAMNDKEYEIFAKRLWIKKKKGEVK